MKRADTDPVTQVVPESAGRKWRNLPAPTGSCFGREAAVEELLRLLEQPSCRLITLTGVPGVGKTRLALALTEPAAARLSYPILWVPLAEVTGPEALADALLAAIDLAAPSAPERLAVLRRHVAQLQVLLVLDSFEHLLPPADGTRASLHVLADLLAHAPLLRCLVTSRVPLQAAGEWLYPVPPLPTWGAGCGVAGTGDRTCGVGPDDSELLRPDTRQSVSHALMRCASVQLFVERARAADPGWQPSDRNASSIARLCRHLDGLPLAIELAAAQVRSFTVEDLCRHWERSGEGRLALLEGVGGRSLGRALEAAYRQLSPAAQRLLVELSVCPGEFARDAVQAIGPGAGLETVRELVEGNWLRKREVEGHARYQMLETIRAFAEEKQPALRPGAERRHAGFFLQVAQAAAAQWDSPRQEEALRTFARVWQNLQRGFHWACGQGQDEWVCAYAQAVVPFLTQRGWWQERAAWTEAWLIAAERGGDATEQCRARVTCGEALRAVERVEHSKEMLREGLAQARAVRDARSIGQALSSLGQHALRQGDAATACNLLAEALTQFRLAGDIAAQARVLLSLVHHLPEEPGRAAAAGEALSLYRALGSIEGQVAILRLMSGNCARRGAVAEAQRLLEEALCMAEAAGMFTAVMALQGQLARHCAQRGDLEGAEGYHRHCIEWAEQVGDQYRVARAQEQLAGVLLARGEPERARALLEDSYQRFRRLNSLHGYGDVLMSMGEWSRQMGDLGEAERLLRHGLEVHRARGIASSVGVALWLLGQLYRQEGRYEEATAALEESLRQHRRVEVLLELGSLAWERGDGTTARGWWLEALREPLQSGYWLDLIRALLEIGRMLAGKDEGAGAMLQGVAARELRARGLKQAEEAESSAAAVLKRLGQGARIVRRQVARIALEEALAQARLWLEQWSPETCAVPPAEAPVRVYLLGRFEVRWDQEPLPVSIWPRPKVRALFQWLCLQGGRRVGREEAIDALWDHLPVERAARNLATTLSLLRRVLGSLASVCLQSDAETLQLALGEGVWVDAAAFEQHVAAAARCRRQGDTNGMERHSHAALALYVGDLLPAQPAALWLLPPRERLARLRLRTLVSLAEQRLAQGDVREAEALARQALQQDSCEESAVRVRMEALAQQGQRTEALRCFRQFRQLLRRELDAEPEAATLRLHDRLRLTSA